MNEPTTRSDIDESRSDNQHILFLHGLNVRRNAHIFWETCLTTFLVFQSQLQLS